MGRVRRALGALPGDGLRSQLAYLGAKVTYKLLNQVGFYKKLEVLILTPDNLNEEVARLDYDYTCRFATEEEALAHAATVPDEISPEFVKTATAQGDRCMAVFDGNEMVSYGWYSNKSPAQTPFGLELHFDPAWFYVYKGYTRPSHRGQRLQAAGMAAAMDAFVEEGRNGLLLSIEVVNGPSLRSNDRIGYEKSGSVTVWKPIDKDRFPLNRLSRWWIWRDDGGRPGLFDAIVPPS